MKTYKTSIHPTTNELFLNLEQEAPKKFAEKTKKAVELSVNEIEQGILIGLPGVYDSYLYKITISGSDVNITKSEHYTDDVNSLALEGVITDIVIAYIGEGNITGILPSGPVNINQ